MERNSAAGAHGDALRNAVAPDVFRPLEPRYLEEPRGLYRGAGGVLALPRTPEEVSALVKAANAARIGVVPYGGGTGLVGGQICSDDPAPLIVSLERLNRVRAVHPEENVMIAEAGVILADAQAAAQRANRLFPLSLAAEGTARIGGNLATNAGGVNVLRYGNARDLCLGLEAVLPDGRIWHGLSRLRKDNTGYDLKNLLIGAEGTLGIITAATLKLAPVPAGRGVAVLAVRSPAAALELLVRARDQLGDGVSAFELIHRAGFEFLAETLPDVRRPWHDPPAWCVLIELGLPVGLDPQTALTTLFETGLDKGLVTDGLVAQSEAQAREFWNAREHLPEANRRIKALSSHDISLPLAELPEFLEQADRAIAELGDFRINCFGHLGDGNLHYNLFPAKGRDVLSYGEEVARARESIYGLLVKFGGSISAEHGIGRAKVRDLERFGDPVKLSVMRSVKKALDPNGIMNPGAVLRDVCDPG